MLCLDGGGLSSTAPEPMAIEEKNREEATGGREAPQSSGLVNLSPGRTNPGLPSISRLRPKPRVAAPRKFTLEVPSTVW